ncbi:MAG: tetratricopeptide repeat protein [Bdellovibrionales bacterium]
MRELIAECEHFLRSGQISSVASRLRGINLPRVPRAFRLPLANVCRRAGLFTSGLRLLTPLVHPDRRSARAPITTEELSEYAVLLMKIGSLNEAIDLLQGVELKDEPRSLLYLGFCHMNQWEYARASELLKRYLDVAEDPYLAMIAEVNLAASLMYSAQTDEALVRLEKAIEEVEKAGYLRLLANLLELRAQLSLIANRDSHCASDIDRAVQILRSQSTNDQLYLLKWQAVLQSRHTQCISPLLEFQVTARKRQDWESVREADFQILKLTFEDHRYSHLYFGSPWPEFRRRLESHFGKVASDAYTWGGRRGGDIDLDLTTGLSRNTGETCPPKILHMLRSLLSDFYAPLRPGTLFSQVFPGERFHVLHSPNRIHQLLWRTRTWLKSQGIAATIDEDGGRFLVRATGPVGIQMEPSLPGDGAALCLLRRTFDTEFSSRQAQLTLNASEAKVRRLIQKGLEQGEVEKLRSGRNITYRFRPLPRPA